MSSTGASGVVRLPVICGPTAAGKSALALRLAESTGAAIIAADSRQVYRGFDVGTAKATPAERARVPHFGIDFVDPTMRCSAADWAERVPGWIDATRAAARVPMVVGGTGFYLRALFDPLFEAPPLDDERRASLGEFLESLPGEELRRWCELLDPARATLGRTQLLRAVEVAVLTGKRISAWHASHARAPGMVARYLLVDPGSALADAIAARVDRMLEVGWLDEVRGLTRRIPVDAPAWTATGYDVLRTVVDGERSLAEARDLIVIQTRQYAKRQRTWFRHQLPADATTALDPSAPDAVERAQSWWAEGE
jgi:tRNA dimethylallyltransferase